MVIVSVNLLPMRIRVPQLYCIAMTLGPWLKLLHYYYYYMAKIMFSLIFFLFKFEVKPC